MPNSSEFEKLSRGSSTNPFLRWMGIELLDAGEGWVRMKMAFRPDFLQPHTVHGGAIYSLADTAATHSVMTIIFPHELATTVEQRINFLKAVRAGDIYCEARVLHLGKTLAYTKATLTQGDQTLVAKSAATQMRLDPSRWTRK